MLTARPSLAAAATSALMPSSTCCSLAGSACSWAGAAAAAAAALAAALPPVLAVAPPVLPLELVPGGGYGQLQVTSSGGKPKWLLKGSSLKQSVLRGERRRRQRSAPARLQTVSTGLSQSHESKATEQTIQLPRPLA
jgi:hypothetical protein